MFVIGVGMEYAKGANKRVLVLQKNQAVTPAQQLIAQRSPRRDGKNPSCTFAERYA